MNLLVDMAMKGIHGTDYGTHILSEVVEIKVSEEDNLRDLMGICVLDMQITTVQLPDEQGTKILPQMV